MGLIKDSKDKQNISDAQFAIASSESLFPNKSFRYLFFLVSDKILPIVKPAVFLFLKYVKHQLHDSSAEFTDGLQQSSHTNWPVGQGFSPS